MKIFGSKPEDSIKVIRPAVRWLVDADFDLREVNMSLRQVINKNGNPS